MASSQSQVALAELQRIAERIPDGRMALRRPRPKPAPVAKSGAKSLRVLSIAYIAHRKRLNEFTSVTAKEAVSVLGGFCTLMGQRSADQLRPCDIERWLGSMQKLSPATRRTRFSTVRGFCRWLVATKRLKTNPTDHVKPPRVPRAVPRALNEEQTGALLTVCADNRERLIVILGLQLGLRRAEIAGLEVGDVNMIGRTLTVRHAAKGGHQRHLPLTAETHRALRYFLLDWPANAGPLIRADRFPNRHVTPVWVGRLVTRLAYESGIKGQARDGVSTHALRHSAATDVYRASKDVMVVRDMLGHQSLATTQTYVKGLDAEQMREAMEGRTYR